MIPGRKRAVVGEISGDRDGEEVVLRARVQTSRTTGECRDPLLE